MNDSNTDFLFSDRLLADLLRSFDFETTETATMAPALLEALALETAEL